MAEKLLPAFVAQNLRLPLSEYRRQYIGVVADDRRLLYINAFHDDFVLDDWTYVFVSGCDGGADFWGVVFDPERMEFSSLQVNGTVSGPYRGPDAAAAP